MAKKKKIVEEEHLEDEELEDSEDGILEDEPEKDDERLVFIGRGDERRGGDPVQLGVLHSSFAGFIMIIMSILGFLNPYFILWGGSGKFTMVPLVDDLSNYVCSVISVMLTVFCLAGALAVFKKRMWELAMLGAVLGTLTVGVCAMNLLFGLLAIGLLYKTKLAFKSDGKAAPKRSKE